MVFFSRFLRYLLIYFLVFIYIFTSSFFPILAASRGGNGSSVSGVGYDVPVQIYTRDSDSILRSTPFATQLYVLKGSDSVAGLCKRYNISLSALESLNVGRFGVGHLRHLKRGDVLVLPLYPLHSDSKSLGFLTADRVSHWLGVGADLVQADNKKKFVQDMAFSAVSSYASESLASWLNQYGTARVSLSMGDHMKLDHAQFDFLMPIWERANRLIYAQANMHNENNHFLGNFGTGIRYFSDNYMLGGNVFVDYDASHRYGRIGAGLEYWRDYLKLSVNGYRGLSPYSLSPDVSLYMARPATGWDVRAEGYLPFLPQLGLRVNYEQYYGKNVALFGGDRLLENPYAVTLGATYTPVPLVSFNLDYQRQASRSDNYKRTGQDSHVNLGAQLTYHFGVPLQDQINPKAVDQLRHLGGSRLLSHICSFLQMPMAPATYLADILHAV